MLQLTPNNPFGLDYNTLWIETKDLIIKSLKQKDCHQWLSAKQENYAYLQNREPIWEMDCLTYQAYNRFINDLLSSFTDGNYYYFGIFEKNTHELVGGFELSNVSYWPKQSASIGYWISEKHSGKKYATQAVTNITLWALKSLNLVKVEAGTMLGNIPSQRVLKNAGFVQEGISHTYGEINGRFEDHYLWGVTKTEINHAYIYKEK